MPMNASYFDGVSAVETAVDVSVLPGGELSFHDQTGTMVLWPAFSYRVESVGAQGARVCKRINEREHLVFANRNDLYAALGKTSESKQSSRNKLGFLIVGTIVMFGMVYLLTDHLSRFLAHQVPIEVEKKLSTATSKLYVAQACKDARSDEILNKLADRLINENRLRKDWSVNVRVSSCTDINAFALPGGQIVLCKALLEKAKNPDEIAGIIAHEVEHVVQRHIMASLIRASFLTLTWSAAIGDFSGFAIIDPATLEQIISLKYSRDMELEADRGAVAMLDAAGISRDGLIDFFERQQDLDKVEKHLEFLSTHPYGKKRAEILRDAKPTEATQPALSDAEYQELSNVRCTPL